MSITKPKIVSLGSFAYGKIYPFYYDGIKFNFRFDLTDKVHHFVSDSKDITVKIYKDTSFIESLFYDWPFLIRKMNEAQVNIRDRKGAFIYFIDIIKDLILNDEDLDEILKEEVQDYRTSNMFLSSKGDETSNAPTTIAKAGKEKEEEEEEAGKEKEEEEEIDPTTIPLPPDNIMEHFKEGTMQIITDNNEKIQVFSDDGRFLWSGNTLDQNKMIDFLLNNNTKVSGLIISQLVTKKNNDQPISIVSDYYELSGESKLIRTNRLEVDYSTTDLMEKGLTSNAIQESVKLLADKKNVRKKSGQRVPMKISINNLSHLRQLQKYAKEPSKKKKGPNDNLFKFF